MANEEELRNNIASNVRVERFRETEVDIQKKWENNSFFMYQRFNKIRREWSDSSKHSHLVEYISGNLPREEDYGRNLANEQKMSWK